MKPATLVRIGAFAKRLEQQTFDGDAACERQRQWSG